MNKGKERGPKIGRLEEREDRGTEEIPRVEEIFGFALMRGREETKRVGVSRGIWGAGGQRCGLGLCGRRREERIRGC